jgi:hypothetical protein
MDGAMKHRWRAAAGAGERQRWPRTPSGLMVAKIVHLLSKDRLIMWSVI